MKFSCHNDFEEKPEPPAFPLRRALLHPGLLPIIPMPVIAAVVIRMPIVTPVIIMAVGMPIIAVVIRVPIMPPVPAMPSVPAMPPVISFFDRGFGRWRCQGPHCQRSGKKTRRGRRLSGSCHTAIGGQRRNGRYPQKLHFSLLRVNCIETKIAARPNSIRYKGRRGRFLVARVTA
jgi:hypothetical protein